MEATTREKSRTGRLLAFAIAGVLSAVMLGGCGLTGSSGGSKESTSETATTSATAEVASTSQTDAAADDDVTTIKVGGNNSYKPFTYLDESGTPAGFEIDVLNAIDELLPQYEFEYEDMAFDTMLTSLSAGKIDLAHCRLTPTDEREAKYLFSEESYDVFNSYIGVLVENDEIESVDDLQGKTVHTMSSTGDSYAYFTNYNEEHPDNQIKLNTTETGAGSEQQLALLQSGTVDATVLTPDAAQQINESYGNGEDVVKIVGDPIISEYSYFLYRKDETELQQAVDGAIRQIKDNGTLEQIAGQWGVEYIGDTEG